MLRTFLQILPLSEYFVLEIYLSITMAKIKLSGLEKHKHANFEPVFFFSFFFLIIVYKYKENQHQN